MNDEAIYTQVRTLCQQGEVQKAVRLVRTATGLSIFEASDVVTRIQAGERPKLGSSDAPAFGGAAPPAFGGAAPPAFGSSMPAVPAAFVQSAPTFAPSPSKFTPSPSPSFAPMPTPNPSQLPNPSPEPFDAQPPPTLSDEDLDAIEDLVRAGRKIEAIKRMRQATRASLVDAKTFVERLAESLEDAPRSPPPKPAPVARPSTRAAPSRPADVDKGAPPVLVLIAFIAGAIGGGYVTARSPEVRRLFGESAHPAIERVALPEAPTPPAIDPIAPVAAVGAANLPTPTPDEPVDSKLTIGRSVEGRSSSGAVFWLVDVSNETEVTISRPSVVVSMFDASGARVGEQVGFARRERLDPGESTVVLVLSTSPPEYARTELSSPGSRPGGYVPELRVLELQDHVVRPGFGQGSTIVGTIRNATDGPVRFARITVVGRAADGRPVAFGDTYATTPDLAAGASSGFSLDLGTFQVERPVGFEIEAVGRPDTH